MVYQINGTNGSGNAINIDKSIQYGKNHVENKFDYMSAPFVNDNVPAAPILDFSISEQAGEENIKKLESFVKSNDEYLKSLPPLEYEFRYMPELGKGKVDNKAVLATAYYEMNCNKQLSVNEFEDRFLPDTDEFTAEALDINSDGNIDIAEYSANIIATDILSKNTKDISEVDGTMNAKGLNAILEYSKKANKDAALALYSEIYSTYNLGSTLNDSDINQLP